MDDTMIGKFITELPMNDPSEMRVSSKPKLRRFVEYDKPIHYIRELGAGSEGVVYLVIIEGKEYAMKVNGNGRATSTSHKTSRFTHPHFQTNAERSPGCKVTAKTDPGLSSATDGIKLTDEQYHHRRPSRRYGYGFPLSHWAIIKDYLPNPIQLSDIPEIIGKKDIARRALIYDSDLLPRNFRGSFLVDLGSTKTYPYPVFWSKQGFEDDYKSYDKWVAGFEIDDETGEVVQPGANELKQSARQQGAAFRALLESGAKFNSYSYFEYQGDS